MSVCYHLSCHDCQEYIWIAQGSACFYSGDKEVMKDLGRFLYEHEGHKLGFADDNQFDDYKDYQKRGGNNASTHNGRAEEKQGSAEAVGKVKEVQDRET